MATVAEQLNNAIYSLASLNPGVASARNLNENWQTWFANNRSGIATPLYWTQLKSYWMAYAAARLVSPIRSTRTPEAADIDPTLAKTFGGAVDEHVELIKDAGRATSDAIEEVAIKYGRPVLFVAALAAIAVILSKVGK